MPTEPILYSFRRCPFAIRARLALLVSGTAVEIREVKLSDKPPELSKAHAPKEVLVQMTAILLKGFDQLLEELLTLLVP